MRYDYSNVCEWDEDDARQDALDEADGDVLLEVIINERLTLSEALDTHAGMTNQDDAKEETCGYCGSEMEMDNNEDMCCRNCEAEEDRRFERGR